MQDVTGAFLGNVERFVRWVYPGLLLLLLIHYGKQDGIEATLGKTPLPTGLQNGAGLIFALLVFAIVASFVIYTLQRYLVEEMIEYVLFLIKRGPVARHACRMAGLRLDWQPWRFWECNSSFQESKFGTEDRRHYLDYLTYGWAITHAIGMSGWMLLIAYFASSQLRGFGLWVLGLAGLLLLAFIWQYGNNTYGDKRFS